MVRILLLLSYSLSSTNHDDTCRCVSGGNKKFSFLLPESPFHAYYRHKVQEIQEGGGSSADVAPQSTLPPPVDPNAGAMVVVQAQSGLGLRAEDRYGFKSE
jgi:hypothetical protein